MAAPVLQIKMWYLHHANKPQGPFTTEQIQEMLKNRSIKPTDFLAPEGADNWQLVFEYPEFDRRQKKRTVAAAAVPAPLAGSGAPDTKSVTGSLETSENAEAQPYFGLGDITEVTSIMPDVIDVKMSRPQRAMQQLTQIHRKYVLPRLAFIIAAIVLSVALILFVKNLTTTRVQQIQLNNPSAGVELGMSKPHRGENLPVRSYLRKARLKTALPDPDEWRRHNPQDDEDAHKRELGRRHGNTHQKNEKAGNGTDSVPSMDNNQGSGLEPLSADEQQFIEELNGQLDDIKNRGPAGIVGGPEGLPPPALLEDDAKFENGDGKIIANPLFDRPNEGANPSGDAGAGTSASPNEGETPPPQ